jgi:hypothetical protein
MLPLILSLFLAAPAGQTPAAEPDGSRTIGIVPPYKGSPAPPEWLRSTSHAHAAVDTRHYLYEVYAPTGASEEQWLVRYVMLPEDKEAYREIEQVFLWGSDPKKKPRELKPDEFQYEPRSAVWKSRTFVLVDRRDLMKP